MFSDPWFVATALAAVSLLGLSKGGFFGLGTMGLPLMSLFVPPMQAAAILLPTVLSFHWMNTYQPRVTAVRAALIYLLEPVFAAGFAVGITRTGAGWAAAGSGTAAAGAASGAP